MILVVGCGFVGGTIADSLEEEGREVIRIDPKLNDNKIEDFLEHLLNNNMILEAVDIAKWYVEKYEEPEID